MVSPKRKKKEIGKKNKKDIPLPPQKKKSLEGAFLGTFPDIFGREIILKNDQIFCGTEPFPELYRAKKYKVNDHFFTRKDFNHIMVNLPVQVITDRVFIILYKIMLNF